MTSSKKKQDKPITYSAAGVSLTSGYEFIKKIKPLVAKTKRPEIIGGLGSFAALSQIPSHIKNPLIVSCTDGVGTKVEIAKKLKIFNTIGIDLVAMCVNDLITCGAEPLIFLDYLVTDKLKVDTASEIVSGIAKGCKLSNCSLVGGETAEHPGTFPKNSFDLAGFSVGIVDEKKIINGKKIIEGHDLIGIASSGLHSNGFSLIRKLLDQRKINLKTKIGDCSLGDKLLKPTKIYVNAILEILKKTQISGLAHITGGGLIENIPRITPNNLSAIIEITPDTWPNQDLFEVIKKAANISQHSMFSTFNCGIGMVIAVEPDKTSNVISMLEKQGEFAAKLGYMKKRSKNKPSIEINR